MKTEQEITLLKRNCVLENHKNNLDYDDIADLVEGLGGTSFPEKLLETLNLKCVLNHLSLVHLEEQDRITYILSASDSHVGITPTMQQLYLSIYYRLDPNKEFLEHFSSDKNILVRLLRAEEIADQGYRQLWYEKMGIVDRLSILTKADKGLYCLNLFRTQDRFSEQDISILTELGGLLSALTVRHARLTGSLSSFMTRENQIETLMERLSKIDLSLTQRERQVCARILLGMSSEGIGLDLEIKTQSVLTYRKRAYARLNISSQNELFALCLTTN